jgi:hypothetical protein
MIGTEAVEVRVFLRGSELRDGHFGSRMDGVDGDVEEHSLLLPWMLIPGT